MKQETCLQSNILTFQNPGGFSKYLTNFATCAKESLSETHAPNPSKLELKDKCNSHKFSKILAS